MRDPGYSWILGAFVVAMLGLSLILGWAYG
jgi:hypothetical protein